MTTSRRIELAELRIEDPPPAWAEAGFSVSGDELRIGSVVLRLGGDGTRAAVAGWTLRGLAAGTELDGLPTLATAEPSPHGPAPVHPLGALAIDHVVVFTPDLDRTIGAFEVAGLPCRRVREGDAGGAPVRQAFFRAGEALVEVVWSAQLAAQEGPARFWGLTLTVADIDAAAALLGDRLGNVRDAVQPGRRIATLRSSAGLGPPLALITPDPRHAAVAGGARPA